jgi:hypothetical protein
LKRERADDLDVIGIATTGGDALGMNAALRAAVRKAGARVFGFSDLTSQSNLSATPSVHDSQLNIQYVPE